MTLLEERPIEPMLADTSDPFDSPEHFFEPKWDGLRCIAFIRRGKVELQNRNLRMVTNSYPELQGIEKKIGLKTAVLDGEVVILDNGLPNFQKLQNRFGVENAVQVKLLSRRLPATYIAFDLLHANGRDLIHRPLSYRKEMLAKIIKDGPHILVSQYVADEGIAYFRSAVRLGLEGIMAKKKTSQYQRGVRSDDWLKIKHVRTMDCVIVGYTQGTGTRSGTFGALVLAAYGRNGKLTHLGNVGTGFSDTDLRRLLRILKPLRTKGKTISGEAKAPAPITWVKPKLVAEIGYVIMTDDVKLRFPRFKRLRLDRAAAEVTITQ